MNDNLIDFNNIFLISENKKDEKENNKNNFKAELCRLKNSFKKLQLSVVDIIENQSFNFKDFLINNLNIQIPNTNKKDIHINGHHHHQQDVTIENNIQKEMMAIPISYMSEKNDDIFKNDLVNINDLNNLILTNKENDINNNIMIEKNSNSLISSLNNNNNFLQNIENTNSINNDNNSTNNINNKSNSSNNNLFVVKTPKNEKKIKKLLNNKRNDKKEKHKTNKKEDIFDQILSLYQINNNNLNNFIIINNKMKNLDRHTISVDGQKILDVFISNGKIKKIFSYNNNKIYNKEKDITLQLNSIKDFISSKFKNTD